MEIRKGDKIFLTLVIVFVSMFVFNGIASDSGIINYDANPEYFFLGLITVLGIPWIIYRTVIHFKSKPKLAIR